MFAFTVFHYEGLVGGKGIGGDHASPKRFTLSTSLSGVLGLYSGLIFSSFSELARSLKKGTVHETWSRVAPSNDTIVCTAFGKELKSPYRAARVNLNTEGSSGGVVCDTTIVSASLRGTIHQACYHPQIQWSVIAVKVLAVRSYLASTRPESKVRRPILSSS
jgi:hypothetical protein